MLAFALIVFSQVPLPPALPDLPQAMAFEITAPAPQAAEERPELPFPPQSKTPYGYCPRCGDPGVSRERRISGNDTCKSGHVYPSAKALVEKPKAPAVVPNPHVRVAPKGHYERRCNGGVCTQVWVPDAPASAAVRRVTPQASAVQRGTAQPSAAQRGGCASCSQSRGLFGGFFRGR